MWVSYTEKLLCSSERRDRRGSLLKPFQNLLSWVQSRWWAISTTNGRSSNCWSFCAAPLPPSRRRRLFSSQKSPKVATGGDPIALAPWSLYSWLLTGYVEKWRSIEGWSAPPLLNIVSIIFTNRLPCFHIHSLQPSDFSITPLYHSSFMTMILFPTYSSQVSPPPPSLLDIKQMNQQTSRQGVYTTQPQHRMVSLCQIFRTISNLDFGVHISQGCLWW